MVLVHDTSSRRGLQVYQVSLKNLQRFSSYRADTICDGQTDRQTDGQTHGEKRYVSRPCRGGGGGGGGWRHKKLFALRRRLLSLMFPLCAAVWEVFARNLFSLRD